MLEVQEDNLPTNKALTAATVVAAAQPALAEVWPALMPATLAGPAATTFVSIAGSWLLGLLIAWFIRDRAGIPLPEEGD